MKRLFALGLITLSATMLVACSGSDSSNKSSTNNKTMQSSSGNKTSKSNAEKNNKKYKIGDKLTFKDGVEITITNAEFTDERNEFDDTNPDKVLKVTYNVVNNSDKDYVVGGDINTYVGSNKMSTYPITTTMDTISAGRSYENAVQGFGIKGTDKIELEVHPLINFDNEKYVVALDLQ